MEELIKFRNHLKNSSLLKVMKLVHVVTTILYNLKATSIGLFRDY